MAEEKTPKMPYGFLIYRGDYSDDAQWDRYMAYLKHQTRQGLAREEKSGLYDQMDWKVISSPELQDEGPERVCQLFNEWLKSGEEKDDYYYTYRYRACLLVNKMCLDELDRFMADKSLETDDEMDLFDDRGETCAILVSRFQDEGWVLVGMSMLMPRAGDVLMMDGEQQGWVEVAAVEQGDVAVHF